MRDDHRDPLPSHRHPAVLAILLDHHLAATLPGPTIPRWQTEIERGFTNQDWHPCPTCHGTGELNTRKGVVRCNAAKCRGKGGWHGDQYDNEARTIVVETADLLEPDAYTNALLAHLRSPGAAAWKLCRDTHNRSRHAIPDPDDFANQLRAGITTAVEQSEQTATWKTHLDAAMDRLRDTDQLAALAIIRQHILHDLPWNTDDQADYHRALSRIARHLPQDFRAPRWAREQAAERTAA